MLAVAGAVVVAGCGDSGEESTFASSNASSGAGAGSGSSSAASTNSATSSSSASGSSSSGMVDPCETALFCETFEDYPSVSEIADDQEFGPWRAALASPGAVMNLDDTHTTSGSRALHMSIDGGIEAGGRLFADGDHPLFTDLPTHVYGRMMMYIDPNGTSVHWTFFGASGNAEPSSPEPDRRATYLMSSLPRDGVNTYSFVYGLSPQGKDPFQDCWNQSETPMPTAGWQCVQFEMDSVTRKLRMNMNGESAPAVSVDETGQGCVGDVVPDDTPWYGPAIDQIYVGAWSFHPMNGPLEVWIDDLVVDTSPVGCP